MVIPAVEAGLQRAMLVAVATGLWPVLRRYAACGQSVYPKPARRGEWRASVERSLPVLVRACAPWRAATVAGSRHSSTK